MSSGNAFGHSYGINTDFCITVGCYPYFITYMLFNTDYRSLFTLLESTSFVSITLLPVHLIPQIVQHSFSLQLKLTYLLWLPNRQAIIFHSCGFFLSSSFFPRLFSAVADSMPNILPHMMRPLCEFRMHV